MATQFKTYILRYKTASNKQTNKQNEKRSKERVREEEGEEMRQENQFNSCGSVRFIKSV